MFAFYDGFQPLLRCFTATYCDKGRTERKRNVMKGGSIIDMILSNVNYYSNIYVLFSNIKVCISTSIKALIQNIKKF